MQQGVLPQDSRRFWIVTPDEKLSEAHAQIPAMNPDGRGMEEVFDTTEGPFMFPPSRPACRCGIGLGVGTGATVGEARLPGGESGVGITRPSPTLPSRRRVKRKSRAKPKPRRREVREEAATIRRKKKVTIRKKARIRRKRVARARGKAPVVRKRVARKRKTK